MNSFLYGIRLQRSEIFQQVAVDEDVAATDTFKQCHTGSIFSGNRSIVLDHVATQVPDLANRAVRSVTSGSQITYVALSLSG